GACEVAARRAAPPPPSPRLARSRCCACRALLPYLSTFPVSSCSAMQDGGARTSRVRLASTSCSERLNSLRPMRPLRTLGLILFVGCGAGQSPAPRQYDL